MVRTWTPHCATGSGASKLGELALSQSARHLCCSCTLPIRGLRERQRQDLLRHAKTSKSLDSPCSGDADKVCPQQNGKCNTGGVGCEGERWKLMTSGIQSLVSPVSCSTWRPSTTEAVHCSQGWGCALCAFKGGVWPIAPEACKMTTRKMQMAIVGSSLHLGVQKASWQPDLSHIEVHCLLGVQIWDAVERLPRLLWPSKYYHWFSSMRPPMTLPGATWCVSKRLQNSWGHDPGCGGPGAVLLSTAGKGRVGGHGSCMPTIGCRAGVRSASDQRSLLILATLWFCEHTTATAMYINLIPV